MSFYLRSIAIRDFRKLAQLSISNLGNGVTVLSGDNEEGKSTLLEAIRTCFFEKYNLTGDRAERLQPYGSTLRPEVRIEFELEGKPYTLTKMFGAHARAELVTTTGKFADAAADEQLTRLFRFTLPSKTSADERKRDHHGLFGMFWVAQGEVFQGLAANAAARANINAALQAEVGLVLGGERGKRLRDAVEKEYHLLLTPTGKPTGAYRKAQMEVERQTIELEAAQAQLREHDQRLAELARKQAERKGYVGSRALEQAKGRLQKAQADAQRLSRLRQGEREAQTKLQAAAASRDLLQQQWQQRQHSMDALGSRAQELVKLAAELEEQTGSVAVIATRLSTEHAARLAAEEQFEISDRGCERARAAVCLLEQQGERQRLQKASANASEAAEVAQAARREADAVRLRAPVLAELKKLADAEARAETRLQALATRIQIEVEAGADVRLDSTPLPVGTMERHLRSAVDIAIPGQARIRIEPGANIADPQRALDEARQNLRAGLRAAGFDTVTAAEAALTRRAEQLQIAEHNQALAKAYAPAGFAQLEAQLAALQVEHTRLQTVIAGADMPVNLEAARQNLAAAEQQAQADNQKLQSARQDWEHTVAAHASARERQIALQNQLAAEEKHQTDAQRALDAQRERLPDEALRQNAAAADAAWAEAQQDSDAAARLLAEADPEMVEMETGSAEAGLEQVRTTIAAIDRRMIELQSELRASGAQGWGEKVQELEASRQAAQAEWQSYDRRAAAVQLLRQVLADAERSAQQQFLGPVAERIRPYLRRLLPDTELKLDGERWEIAGLERAGRTEPFSSLSLGTREQLAILSRLALADLVRASGHPALLVLDDAMVFSDETRSEQMMKILRKASDGMQILILSCRPREYVLGGFPVIALADCQARASSAAS